MPAIFDSFISFFHLLIIFNIISISPPIFALLIIEKGGGSLLLEFSPSLTPLVTQDDIRTDYEEYTSQSTELCSPDVRPEIKHIADIKLLLNSTMKPEEIQRRRSPDSLDLDSEVRRRASSYEDDMLFADDLRSRKSSATFSDASTSAATVYTNDSISSALSQLKRPAVKLVAIPGKVPRKKVKGQTADRRSSFKSDISSKYSEMDGNYDIDANAPLAGRNSSAGRRRDSELSITSSEKTNVDERKNGGRKYSTEDVQKLNDNFNIDIHSCHLNGLIHDKGDEDMKMKAHAVMQLKINQNREVDLGSNKQLSSMGNFQAQMRRCKSGGSNMRKRLEEEVCQQRARDAETAFCASYSRPLSRSLSAANLRKNSASSFNKTNRVQSEDFYIDTSPLQPPVIIAQMLEERLKQQQQQKQKHREDGSGQGTIMEEIDTHRRISEKRVGKRRGSASFSQTASPKSPSRLSVNVNVNMVFSDRSPSPHSRNSPSKRALSETVSFGRSNSFTEHPKRGFGSVGRFAQSGSFRSPLDSGAGAGSMFNAANSSDGSSQKQLSLAEKEKKRKYEFWTKVVQILSIRALLSSRLRQQLDDDKELLRLKLITAANSIGTFFLRHFKRKMNNLIKIMLQRHRNIMRPFKLLVCPLNHSSSL